MYIEHTGLRRPRGRLSRGKKALVYSVAAVATVSACSSGTHKPTADPSSTTTTTTVVVSTTQTSQTTIGQQAFEAYQNAFNLIAQIEESPGGRSTDPRLRTVLIDPWFSQVAQEINLYRLRDQVVRGPYSFANFHLDQVTADDRVIFTDCQTNSQAVYDVRSGALVGNASTQQLPEQVVVYHPSPAVWQVADDNAVSTGVAAICAG